MSVDLEGLTDERLREWAEGCRAAIEGQRRGIDVLERRAEWIEAELARRVDPEPHDHGRGEDR